MCGHHGCPEQQNDAWTQIQRWSLKSRFCYVDFTKINNDTNDEFFHKKFSTQ